MHLLTVQHTTIYRYSEPVELGEHRMMFRPRESHDLRLISTNVRIQPKPRDLHWLHDIFDNSVTVVNFSGKTTELRFESTVVLGHTETAPPEYPLALEARKYPIVYSSDERPDLVRALERHWPTKDVHDWALDYVKEAESKDTMSLLRSMTTGIKSQFAYSRRTARGVQTPSETLKLRRGTCRDFAWLMIEGVRSIGLAARFVSGYLFIPHESPEEAAVGGSTHAWLQVYLPGAGWVDFDPTNSIIGNRNLIRVAVAWDPAQALPLWGTYVGRRSCFLGMEVSVSVLEADLAVGDDGSQSLAAT